MYNTETEFINGKICTHFLEKAMLIYLFLNSY